MQDTASLYFIENIGNNIIKITLKPKIQKNKGEVTRQVFENRGELMIPGLKYNIYQIKAEIIL